MEATGKDRDASCLRLTSFSSVGSPKVFEIARFDTAWRFAFSILGSDLIAVAGIDGGILTLSAVHGIVISDLV